MKAQRKQKELPGDVVKAQLFGYNLTSCNHKATKGHMAFKLVQKKLTLRGSYFNRVLKSEMLLGKQQTGRNERRESRENAKDQ